MPISAQHAGTHPSSRERASRSWHVSGPRANRPGAAGPENATSFLHDRRILPFVVLVVLIFLWTFARQARRVVIVLRLAAGPACYDSPSDERMGS